LYVLERIKDELEVMVYSVWDRSSETAERTIRTSSKPAKSCLPVTLVISEKKLKIFTCIGHPP
jgi:hypothetical protein